MGFLFLVLYPLLLPPSPSHSHSPHSLITHSLTHSLTHTSLTLTHSHSLTHTHSLTTLTQTHSLTHTFTHSLTHSPHSHSHTHSLTLHSLTLTLTHTHTSLARLARSLAHSLTHSHLFRISFSNWLWGVRLTCKTNSYHLTRAHDMFLSDRSRKPYRH